MASDNPESPNTVVLARSSLGAMFLENFRDPLALEIFDAIRNPLYEETDLKFKDDGTVSVAIYIANMFGARRFIQDREVLRFTQARAAEIGYTVYQDKIISLGDIAKEPAGRRK